MKTTVDRVEGRVPVTSCVSMGTSMRRTSRCVIDEGRRLYTEGARDLLLDLRSVPFMGSSGLVALHSLALIFNGKEPPDPESGWAAHHAFEAGGRRRPPAAHQDRSCRAHRTRRSRASCSARASIDSSTSVPTRPTRSPRSESPTSAMTRASRRRQASRRTILVIAEIERLRCDACERAAAAERELAFARRIQLNLMPTDLPAPRGWEIATAYRAARMVGGDFYDVYDAAVGRATRSVWSSPT